jgi:hypothetical protein
MASQDEYPRDIQDALDTFRCEAEQIIGPESPFVKSLTSQKPPDRIYHYTNDAGLKGILASGKLWLTDICSLNDPSELKHGFEIAIRELRKMVVGGSPASQNFANDLGFVAERIRRSADLFRPADFFVCSFSLSDDDLGQWRAYADDGRGFALEFETAGLETESAPDSFDLTYDDDKLAAIDRQIIAKILPFTQIPNYKDAFSIEFMAYATNAAIYFKHTAYENEKEYRFLETFSVDANPKVELRYRPYSVIRYRNFDWRSVAPGALKRILIGPAADTKKATRFAQDCLEQFHPCAKNVQIDCSLIPYRVFDLRSE